VTRNTALRNRYAPSPSYHDAGLIQATRVERRSFASRSNALRDSRYKARVATYTQVSNRCAVCLPARLRSQTAAYLPPTYVPGVRTRSTAPGPRAAGCTVALARVVGLWLVVADCA
jgi:hypothetical protein